MTDIAPIAAPAAPPADPAASAPVVAPELDFKALYDQEKAERIKERNLYRPAQQALRDLDEPTVQAITSLAEMARSGDTDAIVEWSLATAQNLTGSDLATVIAARQNAGTPTPAPQAAAPQPGGFQQQPGQAPIDHETINQRIREGVQSEMHAANLRQQITSEIAAAGYDVGTPTGLAIIRYAQASNGTVAEAIKAIEADVVANTARRQQALAAAAGQVPGVAPAGAAPGSAPADMTNRERALNRLTRGQS